MSFTTPQSIINDAARACGGLVTGGALSGSRAQDAFGMLKDMLDTWSNEKLMVYAQSEIVFPTVAGTYQYTIGPGGTANATVTASIAPASVNSIMTVTSVLTGAITQGQTISGGAVAGAPEILEFLTGTGGNASSGSPSGGIGTYVVAGQITQASTTLTLSYQRPLRINNAFVRINSSVSALDYPVAIIGSENWAVIGQKGLSGAWPTALYYQPTVPLGNLQLWPNPNQGEMHLIADTLLDNFNTLTDQVNIPSGYRMAMRWNLAELMIPEYPRANPTLIELISANALAARNWVKKTNMMPIARSTFDPYLIPNRPGNAAWILTGGMLP